MNPTVQVLLATYNGARFLREQIDSILAQTYAPLTLLARDDGSSDETPDLLAEYARRFPDRFQILTGPPTGGAKANFAALLEAATPPGAPSHAASSREVGSRSATYLAFADQDDLWLPEKIAHSVAAMQRLESQNRPAKPLLVFTDASVVDENLNVIDRSHWHHAGLDPAAIHRLPRLLTQNVVTGCTMLVNQPMARLAHTLPPAAVMHDWWIALLASTLGAAAYIDSPQMLYRQHSANVLGAASAKRPLGIPKWRFHRDRLRHWQMCEAQAEALLATHHPVLTPIQRQALEAFLSISRRPSRVARAATFLRHGFQQKGLRRNLVTLWFLWDIEAAKQQAFTEN